MKMQHDVEMWRMHVGLPNRHEPRALPGERRSLHESLIREECDELCQALAIASKVSAGTAQLADVAKEAADVIFIVLGACCEMGIDLGPVWDAVVESNMSKDGSTDGSGKVVKGPGYRAPDIASIIREQMAGGSL